MLTHRYESAGVWQMFSDFNNHMAYIIEHNPIDPEVSFAIESIDTPDLIAPADSLFGIGQAAFVVTNTCDLGLRVRPFVTIAAEGHVVGTLEGTEVFVASGETVMSTLVLLLPKSIFFGNAGYDVEVHFDAYDPVTLSRGQAGPFYSRFYVGTEEELGYLRQQVGSEPLGGMVGDEQRYERDIQIDPQTGTLRILMLHSDDADLDLHLYDSAGNHIGFSEVLGEDEIQIPNSSFSGSDENHQLIELEPNGNTHYTLVVVVNNATPESRFTVSVLEIPEYPALLETSTETIDITTNQTETTFHLSTLEWGGQTGISNLQVTLGPLTDDSQNELPLALSEITVSQDALAPGEDADIAVHLIFDDSALDASYYGELTIQGYDSESGSELMQTVTVCIDLDQQPPAIPQISVSPNPASTMPVSINGTCEPDVTVEFYLDGDYIGDNQADSEGNNDIHPGPFHLSMSSIAIAMVYRPKACRSLCAESLIMSLAPTTAPATLPTPMVAARGQSISPRVA